MNKANPPPLQIPQTTREMTIFLRALVETVRQLWLRTGGGDDFIARLESECLFDVGIKGAELAEIQSQIQHLHVIVASLDRLLCDAEQIKQQLSDLQAQIPDAQLAYAEVLKLSERVSAIENGYDP